MPLMKRLDTYCVDSRSNIILESKVDQSLLLGHAIVVFEDLTEDDCSCSKESAEEFFFID